MKKNDFDPFAHPICLQPAHRLVFPPSWVEHIPFAMYLIEILKPNILVELGTHTGNSFCAFCQAVLTLKLETKCYAIDNWQGDEHAGFYGPEILEELRAYHDPIYGNFSQLKQIAFDDAVEYFSDNSINLLHIDGLHTYEAVKHDFQTWLPKLNSDSIVLFHDTNVREQEFGVWRYWEEICEQHLSFEFFHGNGLGILYMGVSESLVDFFAYLKNHRHRIRELFSALGKKNELEIVKKTLIAEMKESKQTFEKHKLDLKNIIQNQDETISQLETKLQNHDQEISQMLVKVQQKDENIASLKNEVNEVKHEVLFYATSKSWRITRPLRKIVKQFKRK